MFFLTLDACQTWRFHVTSFILISTLCSTPCGALFTVDSALMISCSLDSVYSWHHDSATYWMNNFWTRCIFYFMSASSTLQWGWGWVIVPSSKGCNSNHVISYHILYIKLCLVYSIFHYSLSVLSSLDDMFFVGSGWVMCLLIYSLF